MPRANHDTDCTVSGGSNGPGQLDCTLPDFVRTVGSTAPQTKTFRYTPSTDFDPATCAVGTLSTVPAAGFLAIDTTLLDASSPIEFQDVEVTVDPTGLGSGVYSGSVQIQLTLGTGAPQCPSAQELTGTVSVRLVMVQSIAEVPALTPAGAVLAVIAFGVLGVVGIRWASP